MSVPRRWFRFSLGALFLAVTVFGCWLASEVNWIHRRQSALKRIKPSTYAIITRASELVKPPGERWYLPSDHLREIPIWRRLMGDEAIGWIIFNGDGPQQEFELAQALFPEARIERNP